MDNLGRAIEILFTNPPVASFNPAFVDYMGDEAGARAAMVWLDDRAMPTQAELDAALAQAAGEGQVTTLYLTMVGEVEAEMLSVFGTTSKDRVNIISEMVNLMGTNPADFVGELAEMTTPSYAQGASLDDSAAVTAYALEAQAIKVAYAKFHAAKLKQFRIDRDAVLNP